MVDITWSAAVDHNNTVTSYTVYFLQSGGTYSPVSGICTGTYTSAQICSGVSISTLMAATGNSIGTAIQVKVTATNSDGTSTGCSASTPYMVGSETEPMYASAPTTSVSLLTATPASSPNGNTEIVVSWTDLTLAQSGYSDVTNYTVLYYLYSNALTPSSVVVSGTTSTVTLTGLTTLSTYYIQVYSTNIYGNGPTTTAVSTSTEGVPVAPAQPTLSQTAGSTSIVLTWTAPTTTYGTISQYSVQV